MTDSKSSKPIKRPVDKKLPPIQEIRKIQKTTNPEPKTPEPTKKAKKS